MKPVRASLPVYLLASALSGAAALLNQVLWSRMLSLVFGSTVEAVATVTAIFMGGLAAGGLLGPRLLEGRTRPGAARFYVRLEVLIAVSALILAFVLPVLETLRAAAGLALAWSVAVLLLLAPASLMGMTLVAQAFVVSEAEDRGRGSRESGLLFAANTFGAMAGVYASVLLLLPALGVRGTIFVAAALNVVAALLGALVTRTLEAEPGEAAESRNETARKDAKRSRRDTAATSSDEPESRLPAASPLASSLVLTALFVAGFAGLANEVAWTRAFILVAGPTVHAFAFVLGAIVFGLALGALLSSVVLDRLTNPRVVLALVQAGVAVACAVVIAKLAALPLIHGEDVRRLVEQPEALIRLQAERALSLLWPAAALSGALFPLGIRLLRSRMGMARALGLASAVNTAGAIAGALLAGFSLLPRLGLDPTLRLAASASALSALALALHAKGLSRLAVLGASFGALVMVRQAPAFDRELFAGGPYKYSAYDTELPLEDVLRRGELVSYVEGRTASVSVKRIGSSYALAVDGKVDATSGGDMLTQRLLAHVPFLAHPNPRTALVIGLGSGVTAAAALSHGPASVTAVEISPEVVAAARQFFVEANGHVLDDPRLKLVVGDARQYVLAGSDLFDVVISEPSNPWMAGVSPLFTREFFTRVRHRLAPGGVFCQWGHLYNMAPADLKTLLATFADVFPDGRVYVVSEADILIVGGGRGGVLEASRLASPAPAAITDLSASRLSVDLVGAIPAAPLSGLSSALAGADRHTDDRPVLDFRAPLAIHAQTGPENRAFLLPEDAPKDRATIRQRLDLLGVSSSVVWQYELAERALALGIADRGIAEDFVRAAVRLRREEDAARALTAALLRGGGAGVMVAQALLAWNVGDAETAMQALEAAAKADPKEAAAYRLGAEIQSAVSNLPAMRKLIARALAVNPKDPEAIGLAAEAELKDNRLEPAYRLADGALRLDPQESRALEVRALALAQLGRVAEARNAFLALLAAQPDAPSPRANFGVFELRSGNASAAARLFRDAIDLDPSSPEGYQGLREAATALKSVELQAAAERGLRRLNVPF